MYSPWRGASSGLSARFLTEPTVICGCTREWFRTEYILQRQTELYYLKDVRSVDLVVKTIQKAQVGAAVSGSGWLVGAENPGLQDVHGKGVNILMRFLSLSPCLGKVV